MKKTGLFGGTFNPIHMGHAVLARRVLEDFKLDELIFIPAKLPPHKNVEGVSAIQRYEMAKLTAEALGGGFKASDYELASEGVSYTYKTVKHWREMQPDDAVFFITGTDIFASIGRWHNWLELFELCNFIVVNRPGMNFEELDKYIPEELKCLVVPFEEYECGLHGRIILYNMPPVDISSTFIRGKMAEGVKELLPDSVYEYIMKNKLYKGE